MARRLNRLVSIVLSAALIIVSSGFDAQRAAAQTLTGRAISVSPVPQVGLGAVNTPAASMSTPVLSLSAPMLSAPSALAPVPALTIVNAAPVALKPVTPAAAIAEKVIAAAPALQALAKPLTGGSAASVAGRDLENVLTGEKSARISGELAVEAGVPSALTPALSAPSLSDAPKPSEIPAAAPAPVKSISSSSSYNLHRRILKAVAVLTGAVFTLPQAGPALTAKIIASAADKTLVLSDFDDTLAGYNEVLPAQKVEAIRKIRAAGKHFAVISDRTDVKRGTQLTVFESLESIPAAERAGMYVAANSGGKVYRYDEQGVPQLVHEAAALTEAQTAKVKEAAEATKLRLAEADAVQHVGDGKNPAESYGPYSYAIMLKPGSSQESVKGAAKILNEELAKRGFEVEVMPRFAKSPENPPYATFSIITKAEAAAYITSALKFEAKDALVIGDAMFAPRDAKKASWLSRLGERLSGRPQVKTGNETDRNMTKKLPGVLALGVGAAMDPRTPNGWALAGHGPDVTQKVLEAVASKRGDDGNGMSGKSLLGATTLNTAGMNGNSRRTLTHPNASYAHALKRAVELAEERGVAAGDVRFVEATASMPVRDGEQWKYTFAVPGALIYVDFSTFFGGNMQDFQARVYESALPSSGVEPVSMPAEMFSLVAGLSAEHALLALRDKLPGFGGGVSVSLAARAAADGNGAQMTYKFYDDHGSEGTVGANGAFVRVDKISEKAAKDAAKAEPASLTHAVEPNDLYALALSNMRAQAAKSGVSSDKIYLLSAVHEARSFNGAWIGDEWRFHFAVGDKSGALEYMVPARRTMVSETMMDAFEPKLVGPVAAERMKQDVVAAYLFNKGVVMRPDEALRQVQGVTRVSLLPRTEPESGDMDLWYSLQNGSKEVLAMNARTGEVRKPAAPAAPSSGYSPLKRFLVWLGLAAGVAALYGAIAWAISNAPSAVPQGLPEGWEGPSPEEFFQGMGGFLGLGFLAGTLSGGADKIDAKAVKAALEAAKGVGADPASLRLISTSGTLPALYGKAWNGYVFSYADPKGGSGQIKIDVTFEGKKPGWRASVLPPLSRMDGGYMAMEADVYARGVSISAKAALKLMRKALPFFGKQVGFVLGMRREAGAKEGDLWYMFRDENGLVGVVNARTGFATTPVSDDEIRNWAKSVASNKGGIYSSTEYNMAYYNSYENLKARGASDSQLALFKKLCDEAPVLGRGFNPWSGD